MTTLEETSDPNTSWIQKKEDFNIGTTFYQCTHRASSTALHSCIFQVRNKKGGIDKLQTILADISNPDSPNYLNYLTKKQVDDITKDEVAITIVKKYLLSSGVTIVKNSSDYITAEATISLWEKILNTQFFEFHNIEDKTNKEKGILRSHDYSLPKDTDQYVTTIFNTFQMPVRIIHRGPVIISRSTASKY